MAALTELDIPSSPSKKSTPMKKPTPTGQPRTTRNPPAPQTTKKSAPGSAPMKGC